LEDLVPKDHILRDIERAIDFRFIYDEVDGLYSDSERGKPGIDPVSLFKIVLIQYLFGIRSMRQTIKEIEVNMAYRWFIGYGLTEKVPHFSTFGKNYSRRFEGSDVFERIFMRILYEAVNCGFIDASSVFMDGTHIKARANKKKSAKVFVRPIVK
jgi:transposase